MSTSTRIFLTLTAVFLAVLVVYYGFLADGTPATTRAATEIEAAASEPAPGPQPAVREQEPPVRLLTPVEPEPLPEIEAEIEHEVDREKSQLFEEHEPVTLEGAEDVGGGKDGPTPPVDDETDQESEEEDGEKTEEEPEPKPEPQPERPTYVEYTVKENDTMSSIAQEWFGDASMWDLIAKANPLVDPAKLQVGQVLRLPPRDTERETPDASAVIYTVRSGDTLSKISRAYYGDERHWRIIYDANRPTIGIDPNNLKVGMRLTIPPAPNE